MKLTTLFSICIVTLLAAPGALAADQQAAPRIDFDSTVFNFGRAKSGETIKHDFIFTNTGATSLEIIDVKPGCGCTTAGTWDKKVEPGKRGIIPLQFNSSGFGGQLSKSATITCNDPVRTNVLLQLTGTVWKPIDVTPQMVMFNVSSETPTNETKVLRLVSNLDEQVTLSDLQCNNASFKAELKEVKSGKEFELHVTIVPPLTNSSVFSTITLRSSSTNAPTLSISAYAIVQQAVAVSPQQVTLPAGALKTPVSSVVLVRNNSTNFLEVSDVRLDVPGVELKVTQPQTGRLYSITMTFPTGFEIQPSQQLELAMKSSHPRFSEIKVPVVQLKPAAATPSAASPLTAPGSLRTASVIRPPMPFPASPASTGADK